MARKQKRLYEEFSSSRKHEEEEEEEEEEEVEEEEEGEDDDDEGEGSEEEEEDDIQDESTKITLIRELLEPLDKDQLISIFTDAATANPSIVEEVVKSAATDPVHRKVFVHGLVWDATDETLISVFKKYGEIEDCRVVLDKVTGKPKGYGFVVFATRSGTRKALKHPHMMVGSRMVSCNLAAIKSGQSNLLQDSSERKLYVANVGPHITVEKLREYFEKFGEIEEGPLGVDKITGRFRGYSIIVYKTIEGFKKAMEVPSKSFEGQLLLCSKAVAKKTNPSSAAGVSGVVGAANGGVVPGNFVTPGNFFLPAYAVGMNQGLVNPALNPANVFVGQNPAMKVLTPVIGMGSPAIQTQSSLSQSFSAGMSQSLNRAGISVPLGIDGQQALHMASPSFHGSYNSHRTFNF